MKNSIWISIIDLEKEIEQYLSIKYEVDKVKIDIKTITFEITDNTGKLKLKKEKKELSENAKAYINRELNK